MKNLPFITADQTGPKHLNIKLTRAKLEALVDELVQKTIEPCRAALRDAGLKASEIDEVILVGGMTRMPKIIETVKTFFGREPHRGVNPDEVMVPVSFKFTFFGSSIRRIDSTTRKTCKRPPFIRNRKQDTSLPRVVSKSESNCGEGADPSFSEIGVSNCGIELILS